METFSALLALCAGNSPVTGEFPSQRASDSELWCFLWSAPCINGWVNNREAGDLRRHRGHYDVIVMTQVDRMPVRIPCTKQSRCRFWNSQSSIHNYIIIRHYLLHIHIIDRPGILHVQWPLCLQTTNFNWLWPSFTTWHHRSELSLVRVMARRLMHWSLMTSCKVEPS